MLRRILNTVRDGWLMIGIALVMFLLLEGGYRLQAAIRGNDRLASQVDSSAHPYAHAAWFHDFNDGPDGLNARHYLLDPYRGHWPSPLHSRYLNIDSTGRRLTVNRVSNPGTARRVFMFGGSSMWGFAARDSFTIASLLSERLAAQGLDNVEVVNLAQAGFNSTQEATGFLVELARGNIPDVAVFLDGYNDIATGLRWKEPGHVFAEEIAQQRVELGRRGFWGELFGLGRHSDLIARFTTQNSDRDEAGERNFDELCPEIAGYYRRVVLAIQGMAQAYGVQTVTLLQPHHATTKKPLTLWEKTLGPGRGFVHCTAAIDSAMADRMGQSYFRAYSLFDQESETVFVDRDSHITEAANGKVADYIAGIIAPLLSDSIHTGGVAARAVVH
jgi:hypothetical protein